jgi:pSer/pThr/pTyr-binding forkhead associated (FHA) protein
MKMLLRTLWPLDENREIIVDHFPFVIGRRSDNDCSLPLAFVSRRHCQFTRGEEYVLVQDLESYNGTYVNGKRAIVPVPLRHGDELTLGPCSFRVMVLNGSADTPALRGAMGTAVEPVAPPSGSEEESTVAGPQPSMTGSRH